jgi:hypothetical protein
VVHAGQCLMACHAALPWVDGRLTDSTPWLCTYNFRGMPPRRPKPKDTPAKLASRMKRRWRTVLIRSKGEVLGTVEAADPQAAEKVAAIQFELDEFQRRRLLVREIG